MHGWKHWLMGAGFFGFGAYTLLTGGSPWLVGLCVVASAYLFYRALHDQTGAPVEDLEFAVEFVRNPYDALVDQVVGQLGERNDEPQQAKRPGVIRSFAAELGRGRPQSEPAPAFDADAAIARYLANRPAPPEPAPLARPVQGFGRKRP